MSFHLGQKIVCICDDWRYPGKGLVLLPTKGAVYIFAGWNDWPGVPAGFLFIAEIPKWQGFRLISFLGLFFRPVVERKTDISIFKRLLQPAPGEKVPA